MSYRPGSAFLTPGVVGPPDGLIVVTPGYAYIYAEETGGGKTRLMVLFPTGAPQQLAIEP